MVQQKNERLATGQARQMQNRFLPGEKQVSERGGGWPTFTSMFPLRYFCDKKHKINLFLLSKRF